MDRNKLTEMIRASKERSARLPQVLSKQKNKFLIAINKNTANNTFSKEDEDFVKENYDTSLFDFIPIMKHYDSLSWNDTYANDEVKKIIENNAFFQLSRYLICAKNIFLSFSGSYDIEVNECIDYVMTHARRFGDPSKTIFTINNEEIHSETGSDANQSLTISSSPLPNSKFMNKVEALIKDLEDSYDETKFRMLNVNVTYIALLIMRRIVKNETEFSAAMKKEQTHQNYFKLCPWPLDYQLPKSDTSKLNESRLRRSAFLVIHAYLHVPEEKTKRVIKMTCVQYMEWCGLQLPHLFFKVVEIYNIKEGELWDLLSYNQTAKSLIRLANDYYAKNEDLKENPLKTQLWFPYCRVVKDNFHRDLSAPENKDICLILAHLVDYKIGLHKSTVRFSHWARSMENHFMSKTLKGIAKNIFDKYGSKS